MSDWSNSGASDTGYSDTGYSDTGSSEASYSEAEYTETSYGEAGYGAEDQVAQTYAMFELVGGGIGVMPDPDDNPGGYVDLHHDAGTRISLEVVNVGSSDGNATVGIELDDSYVSTWTSSWLSPGGREWGYVSLGRLSAGSHTVLDYVNPGSGQHDHDSNTFNVA